MIDNISEKGMDVIQNFVLTKTKETDTVIMFVSEKKFKEVKITSGFIFGRKIECRSHRFMAEDNAILTTKEYLDNTLYLKRNISFLK